jgi:hypothetical protein
VYINALSSEVLGEYALENLELLKESPHLVLLAFGSVKEKDLVELEKAATKMQKCTQGDTRHTQVKPVYGQLKRDPFAISDALLSRDRVRLFVELEHARLGGERGEEVVGVLFWAAKTMVLAEGTKNATEAGLKDYPYRKALAGLQKWGAEGASSLVYTLARTPQRAYADGEDIFASLQRSLCA